MLKIDLAELIRVTGKNIVVEIDELPHSDEDVTYLEPAFGRVTITNSGSLVLVRGWFKTVIKLECGRCLSEVRQQIDAEIEEQYTLADIENAEYRDAQAGIIADEENEVPVGLMEGMVMDLNVLIRQAAILNTPLSTVCKDECLGLCPVCGKNRNESSDSCRCEQPQRHTPLAALKQLFNTDGEAADNNGASA